MEIERSLPCFTYVTVPFWWPLYRTASKQTLTMYFPKKSHFNIIFPRPFKSSVPRRILGCNFVCIFPVSSYESLPSLCMHLFYDFVCISPITLYASLPSLCMHLSHQFVCISPFTSCASLHSVVHAPTVSSSLALSL
jgi:hypothetical protein